MDYKPSDNKESERGKQEVRSHEYSAADVENNGTLQELCCQFPLSSFARVG